MNFTLEIVIVSVNNLEEFCKISSCKQHFDKLACICFVAFENQRHFLCHHLWVIKQIEVVT